MQKNGNVPEAIAAHQKALDFYRNSNDPVEIAYTLYLLAQAERDRANLAEAQTLIEETIQWVERYRSKLVSPDLRSRYFSSVQDYYEFYIDVLMQRHHKSPEQGYDAQALIANERAKARSLLDLLVESNTDIRQGVDPELLAQERSLQHQISQKDNRWREVSNNPDQKRLAQQLKSDIERLLVQYDAIQTQLRRTSPNYLALTNPQRIRLQDIQQSILDDQTALLEYALGKERSYLWVVTQSGLESYILPSGDQIDSAARKFYTAVTDRSLAISGLPNPSGGQTLSGMILPPDLQLRQKRLLIVGDGFLHYIPFAALPTSSPKAIALSSGAAGQPSLGAAQPSSAGTLLIENHELVLLPSVSALSTVRQNTHNRPLAPRLIAIAADPIFSPLDPRVTEGGGAATAIATSLEQRLTERAKKEVTFQLSRLPATQIEAAEILKLSHSPKNFQALGFDANLNQIQDPQFNQYQIVHLATHGIANDQNPELSGLFLSLFDQKGHAQPGFLSLNQIFNLNWPAELVVLSACETGLGETIRGEGVLGLTRGFMYAGSKRVLVSQWSVDDTGTQKLMTRFYHQLWNQKLKPAAALRAAQLELLNDPQWRSPFYWAAFTLQGDW